MGYISGQELELGRALLGEASVGGVPLPLGSRKPCHTGDAVPQV